MDDTKIMASGQAFGEVADQRSNVRVAPRRPQYGSKVLPVESLLHPRDRFQRSCQFDGIGKDFDDVRGIDRSEQFDLAVGASPRDVTLRASWNRYNLDHYLLPTHHRSEDELLAPLNQGDERAHTQGRLQRIGQLLNDYHVAP
ncbi:hypothetical protein BCF74_13219 [Knoellia remsis]|uniref:Uncharacterized protein n=1 Tax=Knoellia remsis TaxID=407159 RepID=A0A2T0U3N1_9MICO|nr:hypothetical protein BCF74_13219 [Knoellia remsis]